MPEQHEDRRSEDGYEIMNRIGPRVESPKANVTVLKGGSSPTTGGPVNLILSLNKMGDSQVQVLDLLPRTEVKVEETSEPLHRVRSPHDTERSEAVHISLLIRLWVDFESLETFCRRQ